MDSSEEGSLSSFQQYRETWDCVPIDDGNGKDKKYRIPQQFLIFLLQVMLENLPPFSAIQAYRLYTNFERYIVNNYEWSAFLSIMLIMVE